MIRMDRRERLQSGAMIVVLLLIFVPFAWREWSRTFPGGVVVHFLDVGQGDSALVVAPGGRQVLIDGGPDLSALREMGRFLPFFDRTIDVLVLSHPHLDHLAAFPEMLRRFRVRAVLMSGVVYPLARYEEMLTEMAQQQVRVLIADPSRDIALGEDLILDILYPPPLSAGNIMDDVNNVSVALRVRSGSGCVLFTGDMEEIEERTIIASGQDLRCDVLKVAHHGSKTSSSTGFLLAVRPTLAVVSVGSGNTYGHPTPFIIRRMESLGMQVRLTPREGTISLPFPKRQPRQTDTRSVGFTP